MRRNINNKKDIHYAIKNLKIKQTTNYSKPSLNIISNDRTNGIVNNYKENEEHANQVPDHSF